MTPHHRIDDSPGKPDATGTPPAGVRAPRTGQRAALGAADPAEPDSKPLATLYVAAYNQERFVGDAIQGAFAQTYQPLQIVLSDDASTDATFAVMRQMAASYAGPHAVVLNRNARNLGIPAHVDRIMEISDGALIVQNAGDDVSLPQRVERLVEVWRAGRGGILAIHSAKYRIDDDGAVLGRQVDRTPIDGHSPLDLLTCRPSVSGASMAWDRRVFDHFGPLGTTPIFEDYPICLRAATLGDVVYLDEPLLHYRLGGLSSGPVEPMGYYALYGHRLRFIAWHLSFSKLYVRDLERIETADSAMLRAQCLNNIREFTCDLELAEMSHARRFARIPAAVRSGLRDRNPAELRKTLKYALDKPYMAWLTWRKGTIGLSKARHRPGA